MNYSEYRNYFLHQAENHPALLHAPDNLVFELVTLDEALGDLRSENIPEKGYIMRLLEPTYRIFRDEDGQLHKLIEGGFGIYRHYDVGTAGPASYYAAMEGSEEIVDNMVEKMVADSQNGHPAFQSSIDSAFQASVESRNKTGDSGFAGWLCLFSYSPIFNVCNPAAGTAWLDNGTTPY